MRHMQPIYFHVFSFQLFTASVIAHEVSNALHIFSYSFVLDILSSLSFRRFTSLGTARSSICFTINLVLREK